MEMKCDFNCPGFTNGKSPCCRNCHDARLNFVNESNKRWWDDKTGFLAPDGCRLPRDQMPKECREYDCRRYRWYTEKIWHKGEWKIVSGRQIEPGYEVATQKIEGEGYV